jgi:hypothetical protein
MAERHDDTGIDRELSIGAIVWTVAGTLAVTAASMAVMGWLVVDLKDELVEADPPVAAVAEAERARAREAMAAAPAAPGPTLPEGVVLPPAPRLQARPEDEHAAFRAEEERLLTTWGWTDRAAGLARVPVERAMAALASGRPHPAPAGPVEGGAP